ncbi:hypothetical protein GWI33_002706 [Rhynchophorus ferrugineus]|uniref:Elongation factor 1-gamma n=1 Tax=Rhynchophorus ferrugineus TaxID=354439 RepID=A0A834IK44_RHYFE|nr:hypothetical protein GWI33_002706 [Rhynchophorus ferrugineus]
MAAGTLYTYPDNFRAAKALIAAQYSKADVKVASNFVFGETNNTKEFRQKFPGGKVPAFEGTDGKLLQDSNAIAYYWIGFAEGEVLPAGCAWVFPILGIIPNIPSAQEAFKRAKEDMKSALNILNSHLLTRTYLVDYRKPFGNVNRWFQTVVNQPQFKAVLGDVTLCSQTAQVTGTPGSEGKKKKDEKKQEKKEKAKKETPKKEPEPAEELDAADAALALEPKSKDPFESLPKGTFNFDDFKRCYSNEDEAKSIPYFWEKFDPENYSIWYGEYKYNEELSKVFMSCNLITGMFQRLDKMRKQAFASVCLFGEDNNSTISGVWVWRGQELAFTLSPDWQIDYEVYDWKKLDPSSEETKNLVQQYFSWSGADKEGRKFNQGKIFK